MLDPLFDLDEKCLVNFTRDIINQVQGTGPVVADQKFINY